MRGVFTCGVLDYMMEHQIRFPYTIAVSSGSCHALSYYSNQPGRAKKSAIDLMRDYDYISFKNIFTKRSLIDYNLLFDTFPNQICPYDYDAYFSSSDRRLVMVATNCLTGQAAYLEEKHVPERLTAICRASCCLPFISPTPYVDGIPMLDGGLADSIPIDRAIADGYANNVVVLTRNKGYRKRVSNWRIPSFIYKKYPKVKELFCMRSQLYNSQLDRIDALEEAGRILVIRPQMPVVIDRLDKNIIKLEALYQHGYNCAQQMLEPPVK